MCVHHCNGLLHITGLSDPPDRLNTGKVTATAIIGIEHCTVSAVMSGCCSDARLVRWMMLGWSLSQTQQCVYLHDDYSSNTELVCACVCARARVCHVVATLSSIPQVVDCSQ